MAKGAGASFAAPAISGRPAWQLMLYAGENEDRLPSALGFGVAANEVAGAAALVGDTYILGDVAALLAFSIP